MVENSILKDLDSDKDFYSINKKYQHADLNDSHMNMSLSMISDQTEIENQFMRPVGVAEKFGVIPGARDRFSRNPKSILKNSLSQNNSNRLNQSVLENMNEKTNSKLFYDVSKGYLENLAISFRRVITNVG
jgi:hypothetical protein